MATLNELVAQGTLKRFQPLLDPGEQPQRFVYMEPSAQDWCFSSKELGRQTPNKWSYDRARAALTEFCAGALLYEGAHMRSIGPRKDRIWEIKTIPPERNSIRIFGWFCTAGVFVVCLCKYKNDVSKRCEIERQYVLQYRKDIPLDEPKVAKETDHAALMCAY